MSQRLRALTDWDKRLDEQGIDRRSGVTHDYDAGFFSKGGLVVFAGQEYSRGNIVMSLPFSRNPTAYTVSIEGNIASAVIPGERNVAIQHLGAKGRSYSVEVMFHNAWLGEKAWPAHLALDFLEKVVEGNPSWRVGWYQGSSGQDSFAGLRPVAIEGVEADASLFIPQGGNRRDRLTKPPRFVGGTPPPDAPQQVVAKLKLRFEDPDQALVNPFKTRRPPRPRKKKGGGDQLNPFAAYVLSGGPLGFSNLGHFMGGAAAAFHAEALRATAVAASKVVLSEAGARFFLKQEEALTQVFLEAEQLQKHAEREVDVRAVVRREKVQARDQLRENWHYNFDPMQFYKEYHRTTAEAAHAEKDLEEALKERRAAEFHVWESYEARERVHRINRGLMRDYAPQEREQRQEAPGDLEVPVVRKVARFNGSGG